MNGAQNIAVIVVNMPGYPVTDPTDAELRGIFLGNAASGEALVPDRSVSDFWFKNSGGKTWVNNSGAGSLTVVPVTMAQNYAYCTCSGTSCSDNSSTLRRAVSAAADPNINYAEYSRIVMIFPHNGSCSGIAGVGTVGCWSGENPGDGQSTVSWTWWHADQARDRTYGVRLATHEIGHNLTLHHSTSRTHSGEVIGPIGAPGATSEYGDVFGTMGYWNFGLYNAPHSVNQLAWMNTSNYIDVTSSGTYSIPAFDTQGGIPKALRVRRGASNNAWFWVSYYPAAGFYLEPLPDQVHTGAIIHAQDPATSYGKTDLADFNPATLGNFSDAAPAAGRALLGFRQREHNRQRQLQVLPKLHRPLGG